MIRQTGAIPATISVIEGFVRVGTMLSLFHDLGTSEEVLKVSRRDLPYILGMVCSYISLFDCINHRW